MSTVAARTRHFERITTVLACPRCGGRLEFYPDVAPCVECGARFPIKNQRIYFIDVPERADDFDRLKGWLKKRLGHAYYSIGIRVLAPTYPLNFTRRMLRHVNPETSLVVDAGSGNHRIHPDIICVDMFDYDEVDIVCTLDALPFRAGAVDAIVSRSVLEHVRAPYAVVKEFHRCTRAGGVGIHMIPFMYPFHASPGDYHRFTHRGHELLFADWVTIERMNPTGPVTVALLHAIETTATLLSFGSESVKSIAYLGLCGLLFPLKFLDAPFVGRPVFMGCAASILSVVRKSVDDTTSGI